MKAAILQGRHVDRDAVQRDLTGASVDPDRTGREHGARLPLAAPDDGAQPRQKLGHLEGLGEIVVGARVYAFDTLFPVAARRQDQYRMIAPGLAPALEDCQPVKRGQAEIQNDRVKILAVAAKPRGLAVAFDLRHETGHGESARQRFRDPPVVLRNKDAHGKYSANRNTRRSIEKSVEDFAIRSKECELIK